MIKIEILINDVNYSDRKNNSNQSIIYNEKNSRTDPWTRCPWILSLKNRLQGHWLLKNLTLRSRLLQLCKQTSRVPTDIRSESGECQKRSSWKTFASACFLIPLLISFFFFEIIFSNETRTLLCTQINPTIQCAIVIQYKYFFQRTRSDKRLFRCIKRCMDFPFTEIT